MAELKSWLDIINKNLFEGELVTTEQFGDVLRLDNTSFYLGFSEGRPVSTCDNLQMVIPLYWKWLRL